MNFQDIISEAMKEARDAQIIEIKTNALAELIYTEAKLQMGLLSKDIDDLVSKINDEVFMGDLLIKSMVKMVPDDHPYVECRNEATKLAAKAVKAAHEKVLQTIKNLNLD